MRTVTELGDLWERQAMADLMKKRGEYAAAATRCVQGGEYGAQIWRIVAMYDRMIAAALSSMPDPACDGGASKRELRVKS